MILRRHPNALITHFDRQLIGGWQQGQLNRRVGPGILAGIFNQIQQHLLQAIGIGIGDQLRGIRQLQSDAALLRALGQLLHLLQQGPQRHRLLAHAEPT